MRFALPFRFLAALALAPFAGCAEVPDLPTSREALAAPWPRLEPIETIPAPAATAEEEARINAELAARAAWLKARAAALQGQGG